MSNVIAANKQMDLFAKLLAKENISVERANVSTASFDILNRVLTLPVWKDMAPVTEQMLILHEVGHALATNKDECEDIFGGELSYLKSYVNIIEDARIERIMKQKYPGSKKVFFDGYKNLLDQDFFGIRERDVNQMLLIDRINIHFKTGSLMNIQFSEDEFVFVKQIDEVKTLTEVIEIAKQIYEFSKQQKSSWDGDLNIKDLFPKTEEDAEDSGQTRYYQDEEFDDTESDDAEFDEENGNELHGGSGSIGDDLSDTNFESETETNFARRLSQQCDVNSIYQYFEPVFEYKYTDYQNIIPFKQVEADFRNTQYFVNLMNDNRDAYNKFMVGTNQTVSYLVKEFEMKKAAASYKRQQQSKTGMINTRKLYQYQLNDDIFRQITKVQNEKRHSMTFFLDWSGSMSAYMHETVEQLIGLVAFCRRINIPFNVFAFSDGFAHIPRSYDKYTHNENGIGNCCQFTLIELFSNKMSNNEFNFMCQSLYSNVWQHVSGYHLNGTPLNLALTYAVEYMGKFISENGTEKNSFILLTDGEGEGITNSKKPIINGKSYDRKTGKHHNYRSYLRDPITKKEYSVSCYDNIGATNALLDIIRSRYGVNVIRFFVSPARSGSIKTFMNRNNISQSLVSVVDELTKKIRKDGYLQVDGIDGVDKLFIVNANSKVQDEEIEIDSDMSARQISNQLKKSMQTSRTSRVLLSRFIDEIA